MHDVVYSVKPSNDNEELRYSLRSLENIPHGTVYLAGYKPSWVKNVVHILNHQGRTTSKYLNSTNNWLKANALAELSDDYIYMNDDFFIMHKIQFIPTMHMGTLDAFINKYVSRFGMGAYVDGSMATRTALRRLGIRDNLMSYELHTPFMVNKQKRAALVDVIEPINIKHRVLHTRTFYGNYYGIEGIATHDVKIHNNSMPFSEKWDFISTSDDSFSNGKVGQYVRDTFTTKSRYEI